MMMQFTSCTHFCQGIGRMLLPEINHEDFETHEQFLPMARVGPGRCCYRIGPIRVLAGWRKRRPEPGLVWLCYV